MLAKKDIKLINELKACVNNAFKAIEEYKDPRYEQELLDIKNDLCEVMYSVMDFKETAKHSAE